MMTVEQVRDLDKRSDPTKLLPTEMRAEANSGRKRQGKSPVTWRETDEARY